MSRLVEDDIRTIEEDIREYDKTFREQTGYTMCGIARMAAGMEKEPRLPVIGVVSVTSGLGVISGFAKAVCAILRHSGAEAFVCEGSDVDGIYEAIRRGAEIVFMADDIRYLAFGITAKGWGDNGDCTGKGFAEALYQAMEDKQETVLVLGASNVGGPAARHLAAKGIRVDIFDTDPAVLAAVKTDPEMITKLEAAPAPGDYRYILDATTSPDIIGAADVTGDTVISAPGIPRGITEEACRKAKVIHNPLELGTLTMLYTCIRGMGGFEA